MSNISKKKECFICGATQTLEKHIIHCNCDGSEETHCCYLCAYHRQKTDIKGFDEKYISIEAALLKKEKYACNDQRSR